MGRGHDRELDMDMEYDFPPASLMEAMFRAASLMEAMFRAGTKISLGSSSTSTSTAVYEANGDVGPVASTMKSSLRNGKSATAQGSQISCAEGKSCV